MGLGILPALLLGAGAAVGASAISKQFGKVDSPGPIGQSAADQAKQQANQKALADEQDLEKTNKARKALLAAPTSGFGPNTNLARSFLTTL